MMEFAQIIILFIVTSQSQMGADGEPTGVWLEEVTTPYYAFIDAGFEVVVASPQGGAMPIDPRSLEDRGKSESVDRYFEDEASQKVFGNTVALGDLPDTKASAIFLPGGHGPMWDLASDERVGEIIATHFLAGKPVAAVCHGPAGLLQARDGAGEWLFKDMEMTAFSNNEEAAVGLAETVPFLLENKMVEQGGIYSRVKNFEPHIVIDGNLITGQNPASAEPAAAAVIVILKNN